MLDDLAEFKVPAVLFSGGEPLVRPDLFELAAHARSRGLHVVLSTNGTLIDRDVAQKLKDLQFAYVGISLDSAIPSVHDEFRGMMGAFERTMRAFRHCRDVGQKVGLRLTLTRLPLLKGRCARCQFKELCAGGLRARAEISTGDPWASDPGCYLTDEEIGLARFEPAI